MVVRLARAGRPARAVPAPHINVCVCTYRRPIFLARLLQKLAVQRTNDRFSYSVVVVDNDREESAKPVVMVAREALPIPIVYCVEPQQSIARARNRAVASAHGEFLAFIDDDELPIEQWLLTLFSVCTERGVDGVLGPVKPHFDTTPPAWIIRGRFHERDDYPTGQRIDGAKGRTGNALLRRNLFAGHELPFRPQFVTGEDQDFFRRQIAAGHIFIWCREAVAYEIVPPARWKRGYVLRRALMRGKYSVIEPGFGAVDILKSVVAIPLYAAALPLLCLMGQHYVMRYLEKLCHHLGKLLACVNLNPIGDRYVAE
jgi:succinoglycan biosynthesis protein ExoM